MKVSLDKQYRTRDGKEVRLYAIDGGGKESVHGAYKTDIEWICAAWTSEGRFLYGAAHNRRDLLEVRPRFRFERWINIGTYSIGGYGTGGILHAVKADADAAASPSRTACIKVVIEGEEGEGLER